MDPVHQCVYAAVDVYVSSSFVVLQLLGAVSAHGVDDPLLSLDEDKDIKNTYVRGGTLEIKQHHKDVREEDGDRVFGHDAAGEGDGAALPAGVVISAVEVHVLGPVGVGHSTTAAKLRTQPNICLSYFYPNVD